MTDNLYERARDCLLCRDPDAKMDCVQALRQDWYVAGLARPAGSPAEAITTPGRPARPPLVSHDLLPRRKPGSLEGRAALIHAVTHIEFNAINLALDAVYRFREMPDAYYGDWLEVAAEEAGHFQLLREHLREQGYDYGSFDAHDGLWEMAVKTAGDPLVRMALVPRVLEARGLDVTPAMMARLEQAGDVRAAEILAVILKDEVGHVAVGSRWYHWLCEARGLEPVVTFGELVRRYTGHLPKGPLNLPARRQAGFSNEELDMLTQTESPEAGDA
ncbi:MAG: ferritin-like domain-containing protein [Gammaproteobacteria bacterium]|nr:ferritin-like domain-containing protein [Gammaproteobacteria bacterium]